MNDENHSQTAAFIWSVADLLRGDFEQSRQFYGCIRETRVMPVREGKMAA